MAEWSNAAVLKTVEGHTSGGSNPSFSAKGNSQRKLWVFCFPKRRKLVFVSTWKTKKPKKHEVFLGLYDCKEYFLDEDQP